MAWLVFALSAIFALAGALAVSQGAPMVQLERGWTEVIAGSVALSAAGVIFAIGVVAVRIRQLQQSIQVVDLETPFEAPALSPEREQPAPAAPEVGRRSVSVSDSVAPPPPGRETSAARSSGDVRLGALDRVPQAGAEGNLEPSPTPMPVAHALPVNPPVNAVDGPTIAGAQAPSSLDRGRTAMPSSYTRRSGFDRSREPRNDSDSIAEGETAGPFSKVRRTPPIAVLTERTGIDDRTAVPEIRLRGSMTSESEEQGNSPVASPAEPAKDEAPPVDAAPEAEVSDPAVTEVGRYQAGTAAYVMYSDGTIHVESEGGGVMRFGSMAELKAFIERQEQPVV